MDWSVDPRLTRHDVDSEVLGARSVWVQEGGASSFTGVVVFLDAEHYLGDFGAVDLVEEARRQGHLDGLLPVYVSHVDYPTRWRDSFCSVDFARFLAVELVPWSAATFGVTGDVPNAIVGVSLTGLAAAHAALEHPAVFPAAFCQSGSFWWRDGAFIDAVLGRPAPDVAIQLSVGREEVDEHVDHGGGLVQIESQLGACRRLRDAFGEQGISCLYREHDGGHDAASFAADLRVGLRHIGAPAAQGMPRLPDVAAVSGTVGPFDADSVPRGLLANHSTKAGVWARIVVEEGCLRYIIDGHERTRGWSLRPGIDGIVAPQELHHVELDGPVRFRVEFLRLP